jgi:hypothetical protein
MKNSFLKSFTCILAIFSCVSHAEIVYKNNFSSAVGPEWNTSLRSTTPIGSRSFLGKFANDAAILTLTNLPNHSNLRISFDLFIIQSWDGLDPNVGPDIWSLSVDQNQVLQTTFANFSECQSQNWPDQYPGPLHPFHTGTSEINSLGYTHYDSNIKIMGQEDCVTVPGTAPMDAVYKVNITVPHATNAGTVTFAASGLQGIDDESWGITNLQIDAELLNAFTVSKNVLWPPNNKLVPVTVTPIPSELVNCHITSVTSNELITTKDYKITGDLTVDLRATRLGKGGGRAYTIDVSCSNRLGNPVAGNVTVTVPHDQRKK